VQFRKPKEWSFDSVSAPQTTVPDEAVEPQIAAPTA
jgi:hypothetical protein